MVLGIDILNDKQIYSTLLHRPHMSMHEHVNKLCAIKSKTMNYLCTAQMFYLSIVHISSNSFKRTHFYVHNYIDKYFQFSELRWFTGPGLGMGYVGPGPQGQISGVAKSPEKINIYDKS